MINSDDKPIQLAGRHQSSALMTAMRTPGLNDRLNNRVPMDTFGIPL